MKEVEQVIQVAEGISNFGVLVVIAAVFLALTISLWLAVFMWFKKIINQLIEKNNTNMEDLLKVTNAQTLLLNDIAEMLRPQTLVQVNVIASLSFGLAVEQTTRMVYQIQEENHILDREATVAKMRSMLLNMHEKRRLTFENFLYNGKRLSQYMSIDWVEWGERALLKEVYAKTKNYDRTHGEMVRLYDRVINDFDSRLRGLK